MLSIKRVPTMVSNFQNEEESAEVKAGCGRNCLGKCCFPGSKLPLYMFKVDRKKLNDENKEFGASFLNSILTAGWEDSMNRGLFRYDVTLCETKVIDGKLGFIAQFNEGRHLKKRPTEFRVDSVLQPFDEKKFNFTKISQEEVLFRFRQSDLDESQYFDAAPVSSPNFENVVAINVSPIEYGHVLLIPRLLECMPQRIDHESFLLALNMALEAGNPDFRLGYNSLGAFATINHLHFQAYYLSHPFPVEKVPTRKISTVKVDGKEESYVNIFGLLNYPIHGLVFEGGSTLQDLSDVVSNACVCLQRNNVPFNILISDIGRRIFLFPQCYAEKQAMGEVSQEVLDTQVNPGVWEISGHMVLKRRKDFDEASEENAWRLLAEVSLSEERFEEVKDCIFDAIAHGNGGNGIEMHITEVEESVQKNEGEMEAITPPSTSMVSGKKECLVLQ